LASALQKLGVVVWTGADFEEAWNRLGATSPDLVVTELRIGVKWAFDFLERLTGECRDLTVAIVTHYPSVASAVRTARMGVRGYFPKPASAETLLNQTRGSYPGRTDTRPAGSLLALTGGRSCDGTAAAPLDGAAQLEWPSLDRSVWEYLNQVYLSCRSMSAAARRLGLDRRSLRRMLQKFPPPR
jgi:two-component system, response regulator RegA